MAIQGRERHVLSGSSICRRSNAGHDAVAKTRKSLFDFFLTARPTALAADCMFRPQPECIAKCRNSDRLLGWHRHTSLALSPLVSSSVLPPTQATTTLYRPARSSISSQATSKMDPHHALLHRECSVVTTSSHTPPPTLFTGPQKARTVVCCLATHYWSVPIP